MEKLFSDELLDEEFDGEIDQAFDKLRHQDDGYQPDGENGIADDSQDKVPEPAFDKLSDVINFDYEILPPAAAAYVRDTSARLNCPPEFIVAPLLVASSALICSRVRIRPKKKDKSLCVSPVLSGIAIAASARTKGPNLYDALAPLFEQNAFDREKFSAETLKRGSQVFDFNRLIIESNYVFISGKIKNAPKNEAGTIESIGLVEKSFALSSLTGKDENLNMMASVVTADLPKIIGKNRNAELLTEFQLALYPDFPEWRLVDTEPDSNAIRDINVIFTRLDASIKNDGKLPIDLDFSDDAQNAFYQWWENHEKLLADAAAHQGLLDHLAQFRKLLPALALIFYLFEAMAKNEKVVRQCKIDLMSVERAVGFCQLLDSHARRIYGIVSRPEINLAKLIMKRIREGGLEERFSGRDIYNNGVGGMKTAADVEKPLALLVSCGHLRIEKIKPSSNGGPWTTCYVVNETLSDAPETMNQKAICRN
jgi:hypothetical protein